MSGPGPFQDNAWLRAEGLTLTRGERVLAEDLNFAAGPGDYVELRGANGSGKTTLLRTIAGFMRPRDGRITLAGAEHPASEVHYLGHLNGLKGASSVRAHLAYWRGMFDGAADADADAALRVLGLTAQADLPARALSQGQQRRLALSRLVLAPRPIWLLDEPAAALDTQGRELLAQMIGAHREAGGLVLAAVHEALGPTPSLTLHLGPVA